MEKLDYEIKNIVGNILDDYGKGKVIDHVEIFAQPELMNEIGLGVPEAALLCRRLREEGVPLPADLYRADELKEHLLRLWKEAEPC